MTLNGLGLKLRAGNAWRYMGEALPHIVIPLRHRCNDMVVLSFTVIRL